MLRAAICEVKSACKLVVDKAFKSVVDTDATCAAVNAVKFVVLKPKTCPVVKLAICVVLNADMLLVFNKFN